MSRRFHFSGSIRFFSAFSVFMMKFRTELSVAHKPDFNLTPTLPIVLIGSCFTSNIAQRMRNALWNGYEPFGALYNPSSILTLLSTMLSEDDSIIRSSLFETNGIWHSWLLDSSFSADTPEEIMRMYKEAETCIKSKLEIGERLIITFGTAWVYKLEKNGSIVANCHKQPDALFRRERLSVKEIVDSWVDLLVKLNNCYPGIEVIFTISPVRHLKDGFEGNSRSKAILQLAIEEICEKCSLASYFPAYEIMFDDLRDYRFYASDLVHPSSMAIEYIWSKFIDAFVDEDGKKVIKEAESLRAAVEHRPLIQTQTTELLEKVRRDKLRVRYETFRSKYPNMVYLNIKD